MGLPKGSKSECKPGDYARIGVPIGTSVPEASIWIRIDRCDNHRRIVYGTIDDELSARLQSAFKHGAKLAASYERILEWRHPL